MYKIKQYGLEDTELFQMDQHIWQNKWETGIFDWCLNVWKLAIEDKKGKELDADDDEEGNHLWPAASPYWWGGGASMSANTSW